VPNRIAVTGASGLIGRPVVATLEGLGHEVVALGRRDVDGVQTIRCDLLDDRSRQDAVRSASAEVLVHLAWYDGPDRWTSRANLHWTRATLMLAEEFAEAGGRRAIAAGSCAEYDWSTERLGEDTALRPSTLYGAAKAATGLAMVRGATALGLSVAWARLFFCYGPGEPEGRLLGDLARGLRRGRAVPCTDGRQERDFLHTGDIARALALLIDAPANDAINIGSGTPVPVAALIKLAERLVDGPGHAQLGALQRPEGDPSRLFADTTQLQSLGFAPRFDLESGLRDALGVGA